MICYFRKSLKPYIKVEIKQLDQVLISLKDMI